MAVSSENILSAINENNSMLREIIDAQSRITENIKQNTNRIFVTDEKIDNLETMLDFMEITIGEIKELVQNSSDSETAITVEDFME